MSIHCVFCGRIVEFLRRKEDKCDRVWNIERNRHFDRKEVIISDRANS